MPFQSILDKTSGLTITVFYHGSRWRHSLCTFKGRLRILCRSKGISILPTTVILEEDPWDGFLQYTVKNELHQEIGGISRVEDFAPNVRSLRGVCIVHRIQKFWRYCLKRKRQQMQLTVCMATHLRLGSNSILAELPLDLLLQIIKRK
jgi:hypothetical protein